MLKYNFEIRLTGILVVNNEILLVKQKLSEKRRWSLPGGRLEHGEQMETSLIREMKEETGIDVKVKKLVSLSDVYPYEKVIHIAFMLEKKGGNIIFPTIEFDENPISEVKFVGISELLEYGFTIQFIEFLYNLKDSDMFFGDKRNIGLH